MFWPAEFRRGFVPALVALATLAAANDSAQAQCPAQAQIQNFSGAGRITCPCFVAGEQAGAVFTAPAADYPLEILRIGIGWGSQFGSTPNSLEQAIHVYAGGLPNPGTPIFTLEGPVLADGAINQFDIEPLPGRVMIDSGPFTVTLEFMNENAGNIFAPSVVSDGSGCQSGKNVIDAIPGGWTDACAAGVSGDWVFFVIYRPCAALAGIADPVHVATNQPALLMAPRPNPFGRSTEIEYLLATDAEVALDVHDLAGRRVARLEGGWQLAGSHRAIWDGRIEDGAPAPAGVYFVELQAGSHRVRRSVLVVR